MFQESEFHDRIHLLCDGMVRLEMRIPNHETQTIMTLGKGDLLAWSPFLSDGIMTTTAIAMQPTRAIDFNAYRLRELCHSIMSSATLSCDTLQIPWRDVC